MRSNSLSLQQVFAGTVNGTRGHQLRPCEDNDSLHGVTFSCDSTVV